MYSSSRAKQIEKKDVAFLSAGIHDDVFLTGVRYGTSVQGRNFIEFKFVKDNRTMTHTEWEPRRTTSTGENLPDDVFYAKVDNQWERIKEILICYYKEEELQYEEEGGFKEYAQWVINKLSTEKVKTTPVRIKAVYSKTGYISLPQYAKYTFIEPMSTVNEGKSVIVKLGIDLFEKPVVADTESSTANPFQVVNGTLDNTSQQNNVDDLPF